MINRTCRGNPSWLPNIRRATRIYPLGAWTLVQESYSFTGLKSLLLKGGNERDFALSCVGIDMCYDRTRKGRLDNFIIIFFYYLLCDIEQ